MDHRTRMKFVIDSLLEQRSPRAEGAGPTPTPAMNCMVTLRGGMQLDGVLTLRDGKTYDISTLKMATPAAKRTPTGGQVNVMVEHHFDYDDVMAVSIVHEVEPSRIVQG